MAQHHRCGASDSHTRPQTRGRRENLAGSPQQQENKSGSHGFENGQACPGPPLSTGTVAAGESLMDLRGDQLEHLPLLTSYASESTESVNRMQSYFYSLVNFSFFVFILKHCLYFVYNSLWCLKLLFIPLSEMYNFISYF